MGMSFVLNYSIQHLVMGEVEKEMEGEMALLKTTLQLDTVDIDREFHEMSKLFSLVVIEQSRGITYISAFDFRRTKNMIGQYMDDFFNVDTFDELTEEKLDDVVNSKRFYTYNNSHMLISTLPENEFFPKGSYLGLIKDISYLRNIKRTINVIIVVIFITLVAVQICLVNFAMERVLGALRELNEFTGNLYKKEGTDLSLRFNKRYGNIEVDKLIVTLNTLVENIESNIKRMEEFSSNVSHELKTPMASMKSMIEIELAQERTAEDYEEALIKILEEINWMNGMIKELLNLTRNPDSLKKSFKRVEIARVGEEICDIMEMIAMESGIDISWDFSMIDGVNIIGDAGSLKQVMMNLINNSIKYNVDNGWIKVRGEQSEDIVKFIIEDCGIGIKSENIGRITERFFREDNVRTHKKSGVGLGLAIVKHILEVHRGYLEISSEEGRGSIFKVCLPIEGNREES